MASLQSDLTLQDLLRIYRRRRVAVYLIVTGCFAIAVLLCLVKTRRYTSSSVIELQKSSGGNLGIDSMMNSGGADNPVSATVDLTTEVDILESDRLAYHVIQDLRLENNSDFHPHASLLGLLLSPFSGRRDTNPESPVAQRRHQQYLLDVFKHNLKVKALAGTRLIEVDYRNPDPDVAAAVVNDLVEQLIDYTFQVRFKATTDASKWLEVQLTDLRNQTTALQARVVAMQKATGLFGIGGTDVQGRSVVYSPVLDRLQQATLELSRAQSNTILKGAVAKAASEGNADLISELSGTSIGAGASPGVANSFTLIQTLRGQQATIQSQIQQDAVKFGPAYPKLIELKASAARIQQSLQDEIRRVAARAQNDYEIALTAQANAQHAYDEARVEADQLNDKTIQFAIVQREANQSQDLYQDLLKRLKEAGVIEGLHSSNLTVVDEGRPAALPSEPNVPLYLSGGLLLGIFLGATGALLIDAVDNRIRGTTEIEALDYPLLGVLPKLTRDEAGSAIPVLKAPHSAYSEAMRAVRSSLLLSRTSAPPKIVLVTSGSPAEGKTTLSINLAITFAQHHKKVLLIETDMRRPTLRRRLELPVSPGLSQLLSQGYRDFTPQQVPGVENFSALIAGPVPPYPTELLGSEYFEQLLNRCREQFDLIVLDTPPILPVADTRLIARFADVIVLVARANLTPRPSLQRSYTILKSHTKNPAAPAIGVVLNATPLSSSAYYEYYGYSRGYSYYSGGGDQ